MKQVMVDWIRRSVERGREADWCLEIEATSRERRWLEKRLERVKR